MINYTDKEFNMSTNTVLPHDTLKKDIQKLEILLENNQKLHNELSAKYSLRDDLIEITDRRYAIHKIIDGEIQTYKENLQSEIQQSQQMSQQIKKQLNQATELYKQLSENAKNITLLEQNMGGIDNEDSPYNRLLYALDKKNIEIIEERQKTFNTAFSELFIAESDKKQAKIERAKIEIDDIHEKYLKIFALNLNNDNESELSAYDHAQQQLQKLKQTYDELFTKLNENHHSQIQQLEHHIKQITEYHNKTLISNEQNTSLKDQIDQQMRRFKSIEDEAKLVIGLSSDAGLAGGFAIKGNEAKQGRLISLILFILCVIGLIFFNAYIFDLNDFKNIQLESLLLKITLNLPFIWLATVANINLNRYTRLEQEYSHKEALARSFERYKSAIETLPYIHDDKSKENITPSQLQIKLMDICLSALQINPALSFDKHESSNFITSNQPIKSHENASDKP